MADDVDEQTGRQSGGRTPETSVHDVAAVMKDRIASLEPVAQDLRNDVAEKGRLHQLAVRALQVAEEELTKLKTFVEKSRETPRPAGLDVAPIDAPGRGQAPTTKILDPGLDKQETDPEPETEHGSDYGLHAPGGTIEATSEPPATIDAADPGHTD